MADLFAGKGFQSDAERVIVMEVRLPRVVLALVVGAGLSIVGVVFQALLRNPLAEPYILGLSSGGTAGALLAITISANASLITAPLAAFVGCGVVMALVYALAQRHGQLDTYALLLSGIMVGALFNAIVLGAFFLSNQQPRGAFLWLMGNLSGARAESLVFTSPFLLLMALVTIAQAKYYNLIATGEETAAHLGVEVDRFKRRSYILASLMTGLVVSVSGVIGFVGLVIPHICRILFGPDHRVLFPASLLVGGSFLVGADILARTLMAPVEIPVGVITAVVGAPLFVYLLKKT
jgi:iron complex transport system permease protein